MSSQASLKIASPFKASLSTERKSSRFSPRPFAAPDRQGPPASPSLESAARFGHNLDRLQSQTSPEASGNAPIQRKNGKKKREAKKREKAIAYQEKMQQRGRDKMLGRSVREQLDLRDPLRSEQHKAAADRHLENMDEWDRAAWSKSVDATASMLPESYVPTVREMAGGGAMAANTSFNDPSREVRIAYDPDDATWRNKDRRIGRLASTFTHELAVHGKNLHGPDADEEHDAMHSPEERDTYLAASRRTFNRLDNAPQQKAFANAWQQDQMNQLAWADQPGKQEKRPRRQWVRERRNSMVDAIERPERHSWTKEKEET
jgi:hypothetical protein